MALVDRLEHDLEKLEVPKGVDGEDARRLEAVALAADDAHGAGLLAQAHVDQLLQDRILGLYLALFIQTRPHTENREAKR